MSVRHGNLAARLDRERDEQERADREARERFETILDDVARRTEADKAAPTP